MANWCVPCRSGVVPLVVLADDQSELNETFLVRLISVAGGAILDSRKTNVTLMVGSCICPSTYFVSGVL